MAGKSGREINAIPQDVWKKRVLSWEGILVVIFFAVLILCKAMNGDVYSAKSIFREMPKYLCEVFLFFPMAYILMMGEIDISVGSTVCLAGTIAALASNAGCPFVLTLLIGIAVGAICGAINGAVITSFPELPSMIVTLGTQIIYRGIAEIVLGDGGSVSLKDTAHFGGLTSKIKIGEIKIPWMFFLVIACAIVFTVISVKMIYGREIMAIGSNRRTAQYSGIKVKKDLFIAYLTLGTLAGVAALFLMAVSFGVNTTTGTGFEMNAIAMAVFGGIATTGGKGKMFGGIVAAFIIICLRIGLGQQNVNGQVILLIIGILLISAVLLPNIGGKISAANRKKAQSK